MATLAPEVPYAAAGWVDLDNLVLAVVRHAEVRLDDLRGLFDKGFPALEKAIKSGDVVPTGPGLAVYQGDVMETFGLSFGFPVEQPLPEAIEVDGLTIETLTIPPRTAAATSYFGSYAGLGEAWGALMEFVAAEGRELPDCLTIEAYVSMPEETASEADLRTDLYALV